MARRFVAQVRRAGNSVDVVPLLEAELNRRYPDRVKMRPTDADGFGGQNGHRAPGDRRSHRRDAGRHDRTSHEPGYPEAESFAVRRCLQAVLNEEWEHRLYAERDLDVLESRSS